MYSRTGLENHIEALKEKIELVEAGISLKKSPNFKKVIMKGFLGAELEGKVKALATGMNSDAIQRTKEKITGSGDLMLFIDSLTEEKLVELKADLAQNEAVLEKLEANGHSTFEFDVDGSVVTA